METIKERFRLISAHYGLSIRAFEERCGLLRGNISNMTGAIGSDKLSKIFDAFPEVDMIWLVTGKGSMLRGGATTEPCAEPVPTPPPEPTGSPPTYEYVVDKILQRNEQLLVENIMLKKEVEDLKVSRGRGSGPISYSINQEVSRVAEPPAHFARDPATK